MRLPSSPFLLQGPVEHSAQFILLHIACIKSFANNWQVLVTLNMHLSTQAAGMKLGKSIRNAELAKVPVVAVIGQRDIDAGAASVRTYHDGEIGQLPVDELVERLAATNKERTAFDTSAAQQ